MAGSVSLIAALILVLCFAFMPGIITCRRPLLCSFLPAGIFFKPNKAVFYSGSNLMQELTELSLTPPIFGAGRHFSRKDLLSAGKITVSGAAEHIMSAELPYAYARMQTRFSKPIFGIALAAAGTAARFTRKYLPKTACARTPPSPPAIGEQ